jgi:hypothetical protein
MKTEVQANDIVDVDFRFNGIWLLGQDRNKRFPRRVLGNGTAFNNPHDPPVKHDLQQPELW